MDNTLIKSVAAVIRDNNDDIDRKISVIKREVKTDLTRALSRDFSNELIKDFRQNKTYAPGDMVRHRGGVFQTWTDTDLNPLEKDSGWVCVVNGLHSQELKAVGQRGRVLAVEMSDGTILHHSWKEPIPLHQGTWDGTKTYEEADEVMWNGCTWRFQEEKGNSEPGTNENWVLVSQRGKPGKQGLQGDQGPQGEKGADGKDANPITAAKIVMRELITELKGAIDARG